MNVKYLYDISNNEILFKKELIHIKQEIQDAIDSIEYIEELRNNIEDYCELSSNFHSCAMNNNYELLTCNNYCIYILNQILKDGKIVYDYKMKNILLLKDQTEKDIEEEYLNYIFNMFEKGFKSRIYDTSNHINDDILETINIIFNNFNLDIIQELIEINPIIFIFSEQNHFALPLHCIMGYNTELFLDKNKKIDFQLLFSTIINVLTECILTRLFTFNLLDLDINILMKEYSLTKEELKISIGQSIANYIVDSKKDKLLNELLHIVKRNEALRLNN